jgi:hypothetical protein
LSSPTSRPRSSKAATPEVTAEHQTDGPTPEVAEHESDGQPPEVAEHKSDGQPSEVAEHITGEEEALTPEEQKLLEDKLARKMARQAARNEIKIKRWQALADAIRNRATIPPGYNMRYEPRKHAKMEWARPTHILIVRRMVNKKRVSLSYNFDIDQSSTDDDFSLKFTEHLQDNSKTDRETDRETNAPNY